MELRNRIENCMRNQDKIWKIMCFTSLLSFISIIVMSVIMLNIKENPINPISNTDILFDAGINVRRLTIINNINVISIYIFTIIAWAYHFPCIFYYSSNYEEDENFTAPIISMAIWFIDVFIIIILLMCFA